MRAEIKVEFQGIEKLVEYGEQRHHSECLEEIRVVDTSFTHKLLINHSNGAYPIRMRGDATSAAIIP